MKRPEDDELRRLVLQIMEITGKLLRERNNSPGLNGRLPGADIENLEEVPKLLLIHGGKPGGDGGNQS